MMMRGGEVSGLFQARIGQTQHPPLDIFGADDFGRAHHLLAHHRPLPKPWHSAFVRRIALS
jgi:hypothetical protein